ncbi:T9SS type A sorting domain-containing protein [Fulvivirga maritima]|uniref:T9SS type A sorting domain-containing protein n=1 Tax=Fulvivirga maritima TaxID=2904247 RepID=UPI00272EDA0F|nr:T9SS type A sorting domain-containing protein [Fulvivirga maritima]
MKLSIINWLSFACLIVGTITNAWSQQIINAYGKVNNVSGNILTVSDLNETYDTFEPGENLLIMQVQDNVLTNNTGNNANFGTLSNISSAGIYELATIESINTGGTTNTTLFETDFSDGNVNGTIQNTWNFQQSGIGTLGGNYVLFFQGGRGYWYSNAIDIRGYTNVSFSLDVQQINYNQNNDRLNVLYSVDGGNTYTTLRNLTRNFNAQTLSISNLSGTSLIIQVYVENDNNEYAVIDNINVQGATTTSQNITLTEPLSNTFHTGNNSSVQIISFPRFENYTTTNNLTALPWNGDIGGVFAIDVANTLTLRNNISVNGEGFSGGATSANNALECNANIYTSASTNYGHKGESIFKTDNTNYFYGRGKMISGGGGASSHNAGGGGGANYTNGGNGGPGYNQNNASVGCTPGSGGLGGADLSYHISADRFFMGGGGGGGHQNNGLATAGGNGGGIVIIRANTVARGNCFGNISITADGNTVPGNYGDGGGGAGAGGSIMLQVANWDLNCEIDITASGGNGADIDETDVHGGGGGGGKGVIIFSGAMPAETDPEIDRGDGGDNNNSGSAADPGADRPSNPGANPDGIIEADPSNTLPITLMEWDGINIENKVHLYWATATEENNDYFTIYRSLDGIEWTEIATVQGSGSTNTEHDYSYDDDVINQGIIYYRLAQTDYNGKTEIFDIISVRTELSSNIVLYPNPNHGSFNINLPGQIPDSQIYLELFDSSGKKIALDYQIEATRIHVNSSSLTKGTYYINLKIGDNQKAFQLIIQ